MNASLAVTTPVDAMTLIEMAEERLFASATALREAAFGHRIALCAIINARSGNCTMDCHFCSQSRHNHTPIDVFPLLPEEQLRQRILELAELPVARIGVVTSGPALGGEELERLCGVIASLPDGVRGRVCGSLGRLPGKSLNRLKTVGLTRLHHNLETSQSWYPHICTSQTWDQRRQTVLTAVQAGLTPCCGGLFGLGESWKDRVDLAFSLKAMGVRHVPMNFLHPHPKTPLALRRPLEADEALRIIAVFRHILPDATLRVCGGRPVTLGDRQHKMFAAGANALMTGDYLTTPGLGVARDLDMIAAEGLEVNCDTEC
ncbi:MAG: biotin synthase BioB [Desulfovibrio sp.]|nr:biotin synthase BioB [Desulfovibrio sp.]